MKVYLAGGMRTGWQHDVERSINIEEVHHEDGITVTWEKRKICMEFINPCNHQLTDIKQFTHWDLEGVKQADIIFCYLEKSNPGGEGSILEIGYALGLGKIVILVDEKQEHYGGMVREAVQICFDNLEDGIACLAKFRIL